MKHRTPIAILFALACLSSGATALPPWKNGPPLYRASQKIAPPSSEKDTLVLMCIDPQGVVLVPVKDRQEAVALCTKGFMIQCSDCRKRIRTRWHNPARKTGAHNKFTEVVDDCGHPCMFLGRVRSR